MQWGRETARMTVTVEERLGNLEAHCAAMQRRLDQLLTFVQTVSAGAMALSDPGESGVEIEQDLALIGAQPGIGIDNLGETEPGRDLPGSDVAGQA